MVNMDFLTFAMSLNFLTPLLCIVSKHLEYWPSAEKLAFPDPNLRANLVHASV